jgi:hypothetical protein
MNNLGMTNGWLKDQTPAIVSAGSAMTRDELATFIGEKCDDIKQLFATKNKDYGMADDAFANFRKSAHRVILPMAPGLDEHEAMFRVLLVLLDKHAVALSQTGLGGNEVDERLADIANYALIARGILADKNRMVK